MKLLAVLLIVAAAGFAASANFSDEASLHHRVVFTDGIVNSYAAVASCMGLDWNPNLGLIWQTSENNGETVTVDPSDGSYTSRFQIANITELSGLYGNGVHYDADDNYLYIADYNGDGGVTYSDAIYCLDVDDPDSPIVVDTWDFGTSSGILGVTYRDPYFYCSFYGGNLQAYTLDPGGTFTLEDTYSISGTGGIYYCEATDVFYTHAGIGTTVYVLDGADPNTQLNSFNPGMTLGDGMTMVDGFYLWTADFNTVMNYEFEDEYEALSTATWGSIKSLY